MRAIGKTFILSNNDVGKLIADRISGDVHP
jgi:hypothetical protein